MVGDAQEHTRCDGLSPSMCPVSISLWIIPNETRKRTNVPRTQPSGSSGLRVRSGFDGLMRKLYLVIFVILFVITMAPLCQAQIEGSTARCHREGEEVFVPGISTDPCISCVCKMREVRCSQRACPDNEGCHMIIFDKPRDQCCVMCQGCTYKGKSHMSGTKWHDEADPCKLHACQAGVITTSIQRCHVTCKNPRLVQGQCCPICRGCSMNGVTYKEGQQFPSPVDPCSTCICQNGSSSCGREVCPVLNCATAHQYKPVGSCCPSCKGTRQIYPPPRGKCLYQTRVYDNNTEASPDVCTTCLCKEGTLRCDRRSCPILDCATADVIQEADTCCPLCKHNKRRCKLEGKKYPHGAVWKLDVCTHCLCDDGTARCHTEPCSNSLECPNNTRLKMIKGQCCPQCIDDGAICTVFGDPHYRTFDGRIFNFQGTCDYILAQSRDMSEISVIVRNDARLNDMYAWTKAVRIQVGGAKIYFLQKNRVKVNKKRVTLPYVHRGSRFSIVSVGRSVALKTTFGVKVTWDGDSYLEVFVPPEMKHGLQGLCGNYNNDKSDDFIGQDGALYIDADEFSNTWLTGRKRCHGNDVSPPITQKSPCLHDQVRHQRARKSCKTLYLPDLQPCHRHHDVHPYYVSCVTDMCECTEDSNCFCEALHAYIRACAKDGHDVEQFLPKACSVSSRCPKGGFWSECANPCPKTCENPQETICNEQCGPGCECPSDTVLHRNRCIRPTRCQAKNHSGRDGKRKGKKKKKKKLITSPLDFLIES